MQRCWHPLPEKRPSFAEIVEMFHGGKMIPPEMLHLPVIGPSQKEHYAKQRKEKEEQQQPAEPARRGMFLVIIKCISNCLVESDGKQSDSALLPAQKAVETSSSGAIGTSDPTSAPSSAANSAQTTPTEPAAGAPRKSDPAVERFVAPGRRSSVGCNPLARQKQTRVCVLL